ncbi:neutral zinc metallopeptidase [Planococcus sp. SSTMD024]
MLGEHFKMVLTVGVLIFLAGCNDSETPETQGTEAPMAEEEIQENPAPLELELPAVESAEDGEELSSAFTEAPENGAMEDYLESAIVNVHEFWQGRLLENGYGAPSSGYWFASPEEQGTVETACGTAEALESFYCPFDDQIVITQELAQQVWTEAEGQFAGDFSTALLVAHQYAHAIQENLGWFKTEAPQEGEAYEHLVEYAALEKNASCLSGIWAKSVYSEELLTADTIDQAMNAMNRIEDDKAGGTTDNIAPEERIEAFNAGYESGLTSTCDSYAFDAFDQSGN